MFWRPLDLSTHLHPVSSALVWDTPSPTPHDTSPSSPTWLEQWPPNWSSCFQPSALHASQYNPIVVQSPSHVWLFATPWTACSMPSFSVLHHLPQLAQTHVHWVNDAIQPFRSLSSSSPPVFKSFQHQGLFQWASSLHQVAKVLEFQLQHQTIQWIFRTNFL